MSVMAVVISGLLAHQLALYLTQRRPGYRTLLLVEVWLGTAAAAIGGSMTGIIASRHWLTGFDSLTMLATCLYAALVIAAYRVLKERPRVG